MHTSQLLHEVVGEQTYWFAAATLPSGDLSPRAYLLPNYDEYIVGYTDRRAVFHAAHSDKLDARGNILFNHTIVLNGSVVGTWRRTLKKDAVLVALKLFQPLSATETRAVVAAAERYAAFLNVSVDTTFQKTL
jgi:hypothetical protein